VISAMTSARKISPTTEKTPATAPVFLKNDLDPPEEAAVSPGPRLPVLDTNSVENLVNTPPPDEVSDCRETMLEVGVVDGAAVAEVLEVVEGVVLDEVATDEDVVLVVDVVVVEVVEVVEDVESDGLLVVEVVLDPPPGGGGGGGRAISQ